MYEDTEQPANSRDAAILKEIRETYAYFTQAWEEIRKHSQKCRKYICGDPWEPKDRKKREEEGQHCINHDELGQYVNQSVNNVRQNRRGIKISPRGNGSNDKTAELRQDQIRTIEYDSGAHSIYASAYQQMNEGSYGFFRISRDYASSDLSRRDASAFNQKILIRAILNQDSVLYDPDCKEPDWSDARRVFVLDPIPREQFKRDYPHAQVKDFSPEDMRVAKDWIQDKTVLVAEYWRVEPGPNTLYLLDSGEVVTEAPEGARVRAKRQDKRVVQYLTNGVEILDRNEQPGEHIPIIPMLGMERYVNEDGGGPKRKLFSLVSLALEPQLSHAYLVSQQLGEAGLSPKPHYVGYKGQFENPQWDNLTHSAYPWVDVPVQVDAATGSILPLPRFDQFTPNFGAYELAKDSCRRAIQAAMGISPLPTAAQRNNEKSGIALDRIAQQQAVGSFHFVDGYDRALAYAGRIIDSWIPSTYDTEREEALRQPDDSYKVLKLNTAEPYQDERGEEHHHPVDDVQHGVTVSTGPSSDSQREAVNTFMDTLIGSLGKLPIEPPQAAKLLSLAIQMKQLGPKGDEMAEIISPTDDKQPEMPPQVMQAVQGLQQQVQAMHAYAQQKEAEIAELQRKIDSKVVETEARKEIERMKIEADLAKAEITTKAQNVMERLAFVEDLIKQLHVQDHQAGMQAADQQHAREMGAQQAQVQAEQADAQRQHETQQQASADQQAATEQVPQ